MTTQSSVLTSGPSMNSRVTTSTHNNNMELATAATPINTGTILSLQPPSAGGNHLSVSKTQQMEGITLPVSSTVNCGGNIIICSSSPAMQQPQQAVGGWNCQVSLFNLRLLLKYVRLLIMIICSKLFGQADSIASLFTSI